jgi:hypothetical protein
MPRVAIEDQAMIPGFVDKLLQGIVTLQHMSGYCNNAFSVTQGLLKVKVSPRIFATLHECF